MDWGRLAENRIQEAMEAGEFEGLTGAGLPLVLDDDSLVDPEWRVAFRLLKRAELAPAWIELDKEIREGIERVRKELARAGAHGALSFQWRAATARVPQRLADLNRLVDDLNLCAPSLVFHRARLDLDAETRRVLGASRSS